MTMTGLVHSAEICLSMLLSPFGLDVSSDAWQKAVPVLCHICVLCALGQMETQRVCQIVPRVQQYCGTPSDAWQKAVPVLCHICVHWDKWKPSVCARLCLECSNTAARQIKGH